jgi:hypothetical protein
MVTKLTGLAPEPGYITASLSTKVTNAKFQTLSESVFDMKTNVFDQLGVIKIGGTFPAFRVPNATGKPVSSTGF